MNHTHPDADSHLHHNHRHHHSHSVDSSSLNMAFKLGITLNIAYVVIEVFFGIIYDSMGLLSDTGHNLSDVFSLVLSLVAFKLMSKTPDDIYTYGYRKFSIQASLLRPIS